MQAYPDGCYWFESGAFTNWTLRNNTFAGCNSGALGAGMGDVFVAACQPRWDAHGMPLQSGSPVTVGQPFANIAVLGNAFVQSTAQAAVAIYGSDGLTLVNNTISLVKPHQRAAPPGVGGRGNGRVSSGDGDDQLGVGSAIGAGANIDSSLDGFAVSSNGARVEGWVVDHNQPAIASSNVTFLVNGVAVMTTLANYPRPD